ncbi:carboxyl-terminal processing protease [Microbulbifer donghaiensis]|uniref:Carboxyl-terminal processing protease n=1 Tax=Microbulbifer donghaiensis TaxID=494016 RepID=A0A1M5A8W4_9GAMM|nr:S41 family peptidase [Microbulbifer donghaiensis]SHF26718.1 carboxyl-terminal processing protease [Microbulbifer donghaiensis]
MNSIYKLIFFIFLVGCSHSNKFDANSAWDELITTLRSEYAYIDRVNEDFDSVISNFHSKALATTSKEEFIDVAQSLLRNFRDPHLNLGPYDNDDFIVYPTGSDIYAEIQASSVVIVDIKSDSAAFEQGLRPGMTIKGVDGSTIDEAIEAVTGMPIERLSLAQKNYALNIALGGKRYQSRTLAVVNEDGEHSYSLAPSYDSINRLKDGPAVSFRDIGGVGYIRFNNALGNNTSVDEFGNAISSLEQSQALIIDLRNTPSGGNTGVAEPILGHFTEAKRTYQRYRTQTPGRSYSEATLQQATVSPQSPLINKPFVVLAGRWTGSMGEGMTIGLDALGAKAVIGAPMADLLGGIKRIELNVSGAWLELGFERLYHVNGSYREDFIPDMPLNSADIDEQGRDQALLVALDVLTKG